MVRSAGRRTASGHRKSDSPGGTTGPAIVPGDPAASLLLSRVTSADLPVRMPPEGEPLKPEQIAALRDWIQSGRQGACRRNT
ncbi:MAG UNVERIFIED_CONTAM: hypothetical protein LVR18_50445 [Planctomycetaceae bacterium]|jgi:hypothetical protein